MLSRKTAMAWLVAAAVLACTPHAWAQTNSTIVATPETVAGGEPSNPFSDRGGSLPSVMRWLATQDIKLTYLGNDGGIKGYLGEAANGRFQTFYPTPDGEHMLSGILFKSGGTNVTNVQVARMMNRFRQAAVGAGGLDLSAVPEVDQEFTVYQGEDTPIIETFEAAGMKVTKIDTMEGGLQGYAVETPSTADGGKSLMQFFYVLPDDRFAIAGLLTKRGGVNVTGLQVAAMQQKFIVQAEAAKHNGSQIATGTNQPKAPSTLLVPEIAPGGEVVVPTPVDDEHQAILDAMGGSPDAASAVVAETAPSNPPPAPVFDQSPVSSAPREAADRFVDAGIASEDLLNSAAGSVFFTVGRPNVPAIYMVADPQCPFCHQTWTQLRQLVFAGKIQLRIIMIAGLKGSDPLARSILSQPDPSSVWIAGQGSMDNVRIDAPPAMGSTEWDRAGQYLQINAGFLNRFKITSTPFLAYVDRDGRTVVSRGVPDNFNEYLAAIE